MKLFPLQKKDFSYFFTPWWTIPSWPNWVPKYTVFSVL